MNTAEVLGKLNEIVSPMALFSIFGLLCVFFAVSGLILIFHWNRYALDKAMVLKAQSIFLIGGAAILLLAFLSLLLY